MSSSYYYNPATGTYTAQGTAYQPAAAGATAYYGAAAGTPATAYEYQATSGTYYTTGRQETAAVTPAAVVADPYTNSYQYSQPAYATHTTYTQPTAATVTGGVSTYTGYAKPSGSTLRSGSEIKTQSSYTTGAYAKTPQYGQPKSYTPAGTGGSAHYNKAPNVTPYEKAVYSATSSYIKQKSTGGVGRFSGGGSWKGKTTQFVKAGQAPPTQSQKPSMQPKIPKPQQLHYCETCRISCAGPQTYKEHLEGQKHKKKEQAMKQGQANNALGQNALRCELCDVTCTGQDAYNAHIRGAKHTKVVKLHTKLGKSIPSSDPVVVNPEPVVTKPVAAPVTATKKVIATPKITFVGGTKLTSTNGQTQEVKVEEKMEVANTEKQPQAVSKEKEIAPVGEEYLEEIKNDDGKVVSFMCKLCDCRFTDPNAKEMHMKGRRHRLQYKKKVNPDLVVDIKPSMRQRKAQEDKLRRQIILEDFWRRDAEQRWREEIRFAGAAPAHHQYDQERWRHEPDMDWGNKQAFGPGAMVRRSQSFDDRHVMAKHATIYPNEHELQAVQSIVTATEKALKIVSDQLAESEGVKTAASDEKSEAAKVKTEPSEEGATASQETKEPEDTKTRSLKGVMRVGVLAKGLVLHGSLDVELVLLCADKPTKSLMSKVASKLPESLGSVTEEKYEMKLSVRDCSIILISNKEIKTTVRITLTSPRMREEAAAATPDPADVLDRQKCLDALASLRHAKWFQARASALQSCVIIIRILKDLCERMPTWKPLNSWALELLCEHAISSGGNNMSPGDALRRVLECLASGIILPSGPGLLDPCEKEPTDAATNLSNQEREEITASAQHALRLTSFRQVYKVLGMEALPAVRPRKGLGVTARKRKADAGNSESEVTEAGKKEKKDGVTETMA